MSRVVTFSTKFPKNHPKGGKPTWFVEKIWTGLQMEQKFNVHEWVGNNPTLMDMVTNPEVLIFFPKIHTIRRGKRWKAGDPFSPRIWSGRPYASKQIIIAPDQTITRIIDFEMDLNGVISLDKFYIEPETYEALAINDGLNEADMLYWMMPNYQKPVAFSGQVLVWSKRELSY